MAIAVWLLSGVGRALAMASDASQPAGAFVGALVATVVIVFVVRCVVRLVRRTPPLRPVWTPSLFFIAAGLNLLLVATTAGQ